ncbi:MAG: N-acetylmuramoyl-L-alanine amidase family protein [Limisphaerales bacterium]
MLRRGKTLFGTVVAGALIGCQSTPKPASQVTEIPVAAPVAPAQTVHFPETPLPLPPSPIPPTATNTLADQWIPWKRWCEANGLGEPQRLGSRAGPQFALHTPRGTLAITLGSRLAHWDGLDFWLGFAPQLIDGQAFIHGLDAQKNLQPLLSNTNGIPAPRRVIVIDPGHGGQNTGTRSVLGDHFEKDYTLDWACRLQSLLATNGWKVLLTRSRDLTLSLAGRVALAEQEKADLFLSLHFNSAFPNQTQSGLETYCLTPSGMPSSLTRDFVDDPHAVFPNNAFDEQNLQLATCLHRALVTVTAEADRGVRRARFMGVLRGQNRPAVLIEGGYLSNPRDARLIASVAFRQKLAEAVAQALNASVESRVAAAGPASPDEAGGP